ncbi:MAG: hypothetical protein NZ550_03965 [Fimbriimonadales bacterium]|nr:hypothetical protein [Fimbriimonadales bacterium]MDW8051474.1 hypothetical protein [Armatimonadota bacterium]
MVGVGRQRRGASLVEVLVVVSILALAILVFIRLYPSGFLALKRSGQSDAATRLAQQELERLRTRAENLPRVIAPVRYEFSANRAVLVVDPTIYPDDLSTQSDIEGRVPAQYASGVNRFRRIIGERVTLGQPGLAIGRQDELTDGIVYTTLFAPIAQRPDDSGTYNYYLTVTGAPLRRLVLDSEFQQPDIRSFEYGIDYEEGRVLLRPLPDRRISYQVEFSVTYVPEEDNSGGRPRTFLVTNEITLPPTDPPVAQWVDLRLGDTPVSQLRGFSGVVPYSDVVARMFERLDIDAPWHPTDPYQYKVLNPLTGTILINPAASGYYERYWRGVRPLQAYVNYFVHDWTILREEFVVPPSGRIRLTFGDLKQFGDILADQTEHRGMGIGRDVGYEGDESQADLIIVDMLTGRAAYFRRGMQMDLGSRPDLLPDLQANIDYGAGIITIGNRRMHGRKIRVLYQVHEEWAISVQKAADRYDLVADRDAVTVDTCWYNWRDAIRGVESDDTRRLYFSPSEAGKTVLLREYWYVDGAGRTRRGTNGVFRISNAPDETGLVYIDLRDGHPDAKRWDPSVTGQAIRGVQGLSLKVRVTYEPPGRRVRTDFDLLLPARD